MKIVFLDEKTMGEVPNLKKLKTLGNYIAYPVTLPQETKARTTEANIIITCKVIVDKEIIDNCSDLKLICVAATGTNNVDVEYARSKGIEVKNVAGYSSESVAQLSVGMILSLVNKINYYDSFVKSGDYSKSDMFTHYGPSFFELKGKTLGVIGLGNIGSRVADLLSTFGMKVNYHSVSGKTVSNKYNSLSLNELLKSSDIVSVHCPLNELTKYLINRQNISLMKPHAIMVNMARGGIINETDIVEALNSGKISGFATDVYEKEPMDKNSPFFQIQDFTKIILTPHIAWTSIEARTLLIEKLIENINLWLNLYK